MLIIRNGDKDGDRSLELTWHVGDPSPRIPAWRSIEVYADGNELDFLTSRLTLRLPSAATMLADASKAERSTVKSTNTPAVDLNREMFDLFLEVRRWRELGWITTESYGYFLDRWALVCVQLRAGQ